MMTRTKQPGIIRKLKTNFVAAKTFFLKEKVLVLLSPVDDLLNRTVEIVGSRRLLLLRTSEVCPQGDSSQKCGREEGPNGAKTPHSTCCATPGGNTIYQD
jgi:hypothetical protein